MITAVDTNILIDCAESRSDSVEALESVMLDGSLVVCPIVFSELCAGAAREQVDQFLNTLGVELLPFDRDDLAMAGDLWALFLDSGGSRQRRILPDFLIGAHAVEQADQLLTRDRGFYRDYFQDLKIIEPT